MTAPSERLSRCSSPPLSVSSVSDASVRRYHTVPYGTRYELSRAEPWKAGEVNSDVRRPLNSLVAVGHSGSTTMRSDRLDPHLFSEIR